jgi:hypothetical protein
MITMLQPASQPELGFNVSVALGGFSAVGPTANSLHQLIETLLRDSQPE